MMKTITDVPGFRAAGVTCGLKTSGNKDLALVLSERPAVWAGVFTTNQFQAASVQANRALLQQTGGQGLRAVLINAGNANAITGEPGMRNRLALADEVARRAQLSPQSVAVMSTGVIGRQLPMDKLSVGVAQAVSALSPQGGQAAAEAIMTTDLVPKTAFATVTINDQTISIGGMAKGSGMIHPNMATMLSLIVTDAPLTPADAAAALRQAVAVSFNRISVDGDSSTNDTVLLMATGDSDEALTGAALAQFQTALTGVCIDLAKQIARDGEGATKLIEIEVTGAATQAEAALAAATLATSPLSKTALFGNDPNWGRFLAAIGRSGAQVNPDKTDLWLQIGADRTQLVAQGLPLPFDDAALSRALAATDTVIIRAALGVGNATATYWTCDFSYDYVKINAEYHT